MSSVLPEQIIAEVLAHTSVDEPLAIVAALQAAGWLVTPTSVSPEVRAAARELRIELLEQLGRLEEARALRASPTLPSVSPDSPLLEVEPGSATPYEFKRGFFAAREVIRLRIAAAQAEVPPLPTPEEVVEKLEESRDSFPKSGDDLRALQVAAIKADRNQRSVHVRPSTSDSRVKLAKVLTGLSDEEWAIAIEEGTEHLSGYFDAADRIIAAGFHEDA